jgi:DNA-binding MarR family transcriptional regulator
MSVPSMLEATQSTRASTDDDRSRDESPVGLFTTLARTGLFLEALQRECLGHHDLTFTEYSVLRLLQSAPERRLAPSLLADRIVCTTGAMTKLVDRLQRAGLVERAPDPSDRRGVLVEITPDGRRLANAAARTYRAGRQRVLDRLDDREAERVHSSLLRLLEVLETDRSMQ